MGNPPLSNGGTVTEKSTRQPARASEHTGPMNRSLCPAFGLICVAALSGFLCTASGEPAAEASSKKAAAPPRLPPLELPIPDSVFAKTDRQWMGVYLYGHKTGWAVQSLGPAVVEGRPCISSSFEITTELKAFSRVSKRFTATRKWYHKAPPYRLFLAEQTEQLGEQSRRVVLRSDAGTGYSMKITEGGVTKAGPALQLDLRLCQETTPAVWAADPARRPGDAITSTELSPNGTLTNGVQTATIRRAAHWSGPAGKIPLWELDVYDYGTQTSFVTRISRQDGNAVSLPVDGTMDMRSEPERVAKQMPDGAPDVYLLTGISASRKLGHPAALSEVVMEITAPSGKRVPDLPQTANQTVQRKSDGSVIVKTTRHGGKPQKASAAERADALKFTPRYPLASETVTKLAAAAVKGATGDRARVQSILRFTRAYIQEAPNAKSLSVMDIIQSKKGDCTAHSLFFTTLARAAGIPAREVAGWIYAGDGIQVFGGHAWCEVILDGQWVPVDSVWTEMQINPGHIQRNSPAASGAKPLEFVTGLKARIISFETTNP